MPVRWIAVAFAAFILACPTGVAAVDLTREEAQALEAALVKGPTTLDISGVAKLNLPGRYTFLPKAQSLEVISRQGGGTSDALVGLVIPGQEAGKLPCFIVIDYSPVGFVSDSDAKEIDADKLLQQFGDHAETQNKTRAEKGIAPVHVVGWATPPFYDPGSRRLIWSLEVRQDSAPGEPAHPVYVNYNTRLLGRGGYVSVNLVTPLDALADNQAYGNQILQAISFDPGRQYGDYNAKTDKTAEYGLVALIGGVALHKLGLFALGAAFFAKFTKIILLSAAGLGLVIKRIVGRRKSP